MAEEVGTPPMIATLGRVIARAERLRLRKRGKSGLILQMWFGVGDFNKPFKPARAPFDWLSRDVKEGRRLCRRSALRLSIHLTTRDSTCSTPCRASLSSASLAAIRKDFPIYVFSGERDPLGMQAILHGSAGRRASGRRRSTSALRRSSIR